MIARKYFIVSLISLIVSGVTSYSLIYQFQSTWQKNHASSQPIRFVSNDAEPSVINSGRFAGSSPTSFTRAAAQSTPSVVHIKFMSGKEDNIWGMETGTSSGSGVIISADGYIITNRHVVEGATELLVTLADNREFKARIIGQDASTDIAVIKVNAKNLDPISMGNSDSLSVGEWVLAVGNPFNLSSTVTAGIVSAKGRSIDILDDAYRIESFIQTDAAVNPGNSGGALVNTAGNLVGINTAIVTKSGRYEGYSFAVPVNVVRKVVKDIIEFGTVQRAILGIGPEDLTDNLAKSLRLREVSGVYVGRVNPGGAADKAGLKPADVIRRIDKSLINSVPKLQEVLATYRPGAMIDIEYIRDGKSFFTKATLKNRMNESINVAATTDKISDELGFELRGLTGEEKTKIARGAAIVHSITKKGVIAQTNMELGFVITRVNEVLVNTPAQVLNEIKKINGVVKLDGVYVNYPGRYSYQFRR